MVWMSGAGYFFFKAKRKGSNSMNCAVNTDPRRAPLMLLSKKRADVAAEKESPMILPRVSGRSRYDGATHRGKR